jgi:hypothetical protein
MFKEKSLASGFSFFTTPADAEIHVQTNMAKLKQYLTESELTDDVKGAYEKQNDGRYKLKDLDDGHSLAVAIKEVTDKADKRQTEIDRLNVDKTNLERERDEAKGKTIPHGFRAVPKEVAELGEAVKTIGLTKEEIGTLKSENESFKTEKDKGEKLALRKRTAKFLGYQNEDAFARLAEGLDITEDGDKFNVKDGDTTVPLTKEFVEKHEAFAPFIGSLTTQPKKTPFPETGGGETGNIYDQIRENVKNETKTEKVDIGARFGRPETV